MANATVGTVTALSADGSIAAPSADNLDTGTAAVTLLYDVKGESDRVFFRVTNGGAHSATFAVNAGQYPPAFRSGVGGVSATVAAGAVAYVGPVSTGRCVQNGTNAGQLSVTFTPSGGDTITGTITCLKLPLV